MNRENEHFVNSRTNVSFFNTGSALECLGFFGGGLIEFFLMLSISHKKLDFKPFTGESRTFFLVYYLPVTSVLLFSRPR